MSKSNSAQVIVSLTLTLSTMIVCTITASAQMVGMVVHPNAQPRYTPVAVTPRGRFPAPNSLPRDEQNKREQNTNRPTPVIVHVYPGGRPANPDNRYGNDGRIFVRPPLAGERLDTFVAQMVIEHSQKLSCERLGDILRHLANDLLAAARLPATPTPAERRGGDRNETLSRSRARALHDNMRHPDFHKTLLARLSESFKGCNKQCFDDGVAVGVISGTGYCNAAVELSGLPGDGFKAQERLPVCGTETFIGCQQGYTQAANAVAGCLEYASGQNLRAFDDSISQDCHVDQP